MKLLRSVFFIVALSLLFYTCNDNSVHVSNSSSTNVTDGGDPMAAFLYNCSISQDYSPSQRTGCLDGVSVPLTSGNTFVNSGTTGCWEGNALTFTTNSYNYGNYYYCGTVNVSGSFTRMACSDEWSHVGGIRIKQNGNVIDYSTLYSVINCSQIPETAYFSWNFTLQPNTTYEVVAYDCLP